MKRKLKVALIQQSKSADVESNRRRLESAVRCAASAHHPDLIVLQELHDSLYFCQTEDAGAFDLAIEIPSAVTDRYATLARETGAVIVTSLFERRAPGLYHNTAVVFDSDGSIAGQYRKMHIPDDPAYYEKYYFTPGDQGFRPIDTSIGRLGVMVCWDQWYPEGARVMALSGAEILIYPTAIGWESSDCADEKDRQLQAWITIQRSHAIANGIPVISVNRTGYEPDPSGSTGGITFWGHSFAAGPQGEVLTMAPADTEWADVVEIDCDRTETVRRWWPFMRDRRIDCYAPILKRYND